MSVNYEDQIFFDSINNNEEFNSIDRTNLIHKMKVNETDDEFYGMIYDLQNEKVVYIPSQISPPEFIEPIGNIVIQEDDKIITVDNSPKNKYFPFTKGEGLSKTIQKMNLTIVEHKDDEMTKNKKISISSKFKVTNYMIDKKGKAKKEKKKRKYKPDDVRKKIKSKFHKKLKDILKNYLEMIGYKKKIIDLPQDFITDRTIDFNHSILNKTFEDIIRGEYTMSGNKKKQSTNDKLETNIKILEKLKDNPEIENKSKIEDIIHMKYKEILNAYFHSKEFEESLLNLAQNDDIEYTKVYIKNALCFVKFFENNKKNYRKRTDIDDIISIEEYEE